jgi:hypothetical protein
MINRYSIKYFIIIILIFCANAKIMAQASGNATTSVTFTSVAKLAIASSGSSSLALGVPSVVGSSVTNSASDETKWINFTSAVASGISRRIVASISAGTVTNGLLLKLGLNTPIGGGGTLGSILASTASPITLSSSTSTILDGITGAYTGSGIGSGFKLKYTLNISNYGLLRQGTQTLQITYTLIDN